MKIWDRDNGMAKKPFYFDDNNEHSFTANEAAVADFAKMGMAVGTAFDITGSIVVGHDSGNCAKALAESFISGLLSTGVKVFNLGECTPQQIMYATSKLNSSAGCYVSSTYKAKIQIKGKGGLPLKRAIECRIENAYTSNYFRTLDSNDYAKAYDFSDTKALYGIHLEKMLPDELHGILVNIRCTSRQTAKIADRLFHERNDIDGERIVFSISSDGTNCSAYSEKTGYVFHERLIMLAMKALYESGHEVSLPYTFPSCAEDLAKNYGSQVFRYYSSSDDSGDEMGRLVAQRADNLFVRDALGLICVILGYLSSSNQTFPQAVDNIPKVSTVQRFVSSKVSLHELKQKFADENNVSPDGVLYTKDDTRAIIRPQKNGQGLMIFAESFKSESASAICDEIQDALKRYEDIGK